MSVVKKGSFGLRKSIARLRNTKRTLPRIIAKDSLNFFLRSFRRGGFTDRAFTVWPKRFKRLSRTRTSRLLKEKATLIKSSKLIRSLQILLANFNIIKLGTRNVPYAVAHNEGEGKQPLRKFMDDSHKLNKQNLARIRKEFDKVFNV